MRQTRSAPARYSGDFSRSRRCAVEQGVDQRLASRPGGAGLVRLLCQLHQPVGVNRLPERFPPQQGPPRPVGRDGDAGPGFFSRILGQQLLPALDDLAIRLQPVVALAGDGVEPGGQCLLGGEVADPAGQLLESPASCSTPRQVAQQPHRSGVILLLLRA